jgi:tight adherence protein C
MKLDWHIYRLGFIAAMAIAAGLVVYTLASAPTRLAPRVGTRGVQRDRAMKGSSLFANTEPLVRWMGMRLSGLLSAKTVEALEKELRLAGDFAGLTAEEFVGLMVLGGLGGALVGFVFGTAIDNLQLMLLFITPAGAALPYMTVTSEAERRMLQIRRGLPGAIDLMALSMSAGLDFPGAIRQVVEKATCPDVPTIDEFRYMLSGLQLGRTRKQVMLEFAHRAPIASVREFAGAIVQAEERGNPIAPVLTIQAELLRRDRTANAEEQAAKAGVKMMGPLLLLFAAIIILLVGPMVMKLANQGL